MRGWRGSERRLLVIICWIKDRMHLSWSLAWAFGYWVWGVEFRDWG